MNIEKRKLIVSDSNSYRSDIIKNIYNDFPSYDGFDGKRVIKMAHCGCSQYCDYVLLTDGLYIYIDGQFYPVIKLKDDVLNLSNIYDFIVTKSGYGYYHGDDLLISGFTIDDGKYTLVIASISVSFSKNDHKTLNIESNDVFRLTLYAMEENSDEPEYVMGMQSSYKYAYIATNYRLVVISEEITSQYDKIRKIHEFIYPSDMIRPNAMALSTTDDVILYYKNDIIPVYYKFTGIDSDAHWHSFVDQGEYQVVDAIIFNNSLIAYGNDSKIHVINNIHEKNPSVDDFITYAGHSWVGRIFYDTGNIFMKCTNIDANAQTRVDFIYSINGINFDRYYSEIIPQVTNETSIQTITDSCIYMGHGSIIIYGDLYPRFDMLKIQADMCNFEYIEEHKNVEILSISNYQQSSWGIYTNIDVPSNLKRIDLTVFNNVNVESMQKNPIMVEYHDLVQYENYEVVYNNELNRYLLLIILKSTEELTVDNLSIDVSFSCAV